MKKEAAVSVIICLVIGAVVFASLALAQGKKQQSKQDFSQLKIITYNSGMTGFFDPDTGKLYIYDLKMEQCFAIRQLVTLGEPLEKVKNRQVLPL